MWAALVTARGYNMPADACPPSRHRPASQRYHMWNHISVSLLTVRHADPDVRRRGRLLLIACLVVIGFLIVFVPLLLLVRQMAAALAIIGVLPLVLGTLVLARSGRVVAGAALLLTILLLEPPVV